MLGGFLYTLQLIVSFEFKIFHAGPSCPEGWSIFRGRCYSLKVDFNDIDECRSECKEVGGDLASIHDQEENDFVASFIKDRPVRGGEKDTWIAGSITEHGGQFTWLDGSPWDFENWDLGKQDI